MYKVSLHRDKETGQVCLSLPTLHNVADFGVTPEEALKNVKKLALFAIECLQEDGLPIPESDPIQDGELYLSFDIQERAPRRHRPAART
jgi:predicted RNase H-like HicB family nuclease